MDNLPQTIAEDLAPLCESLSTLGLRPSLVRRDDSAMGSYVVRFAGPVSLTIVCDRGQLFIEGERALLEPLGLWNTHEDRTEFAARVARFAKTRLEHA